MVDNVTITEGSGTQIAADDVGGVKYQRIKVATGEDGTANDVSSSNPLPTQVIQGDNTLAVDYQPTLRQMLFALMYPNWLDRTLNAIRVAVINTIGTVTTVTGVTTVSTVTGVTTVSTVTNQTNIGSYTADIQNYAGLKTAWSQTVRGRIS